MAEGIGTFTLAGNLTSAPRLYQSKNGKAYGYIKMAINRRVKVGEEWQDKAAFLDVALFGKNAENAAEHLDKGDLVMVSGRIESKVPGEQYPYHIPDLVGETLVWPRKPKPQTLGEYANEYGDPMGDDINF